MNLKASIKYGSTNFAKFKGRATRSEFWYWVLFFWLCELAAITVDSILFRGAYDYGSVSAFVYALPTNLVGLIFLIPNLSILVRRLHDTDHRAWWLLISLIPFGGLVLLIWLCSEGSSEHNRFNSVTKE